jgi:membrane protease YdiL (CAAX protease family)
MTDEETDRKPSRLPTSAPDGGRGFSQLLTMGVSFLLLSLLAVMTLSGNDSARLFLLEKPVETSERVFERSLWIDDAITTLPEWSQRFVRTIVDAGPSTREDAIRAFTEVLTAAGSPKLAPDGKPATIDPLLLDGLRARRMVLLADVDRLEEAAGDVRTLIADGHPSFVDAVKRAWSRVHSDDVRAFAAYDVSIAGEDWIGKHLQHRLALATGSDDVRASIERSILERRGEVAARLRRVVLAEILPLLAGFVILLVWIARNRPMGIQSSAEIPPTWSFQDGYGVVVRSAFGAIGIAIVLGQLAAWLDHSGHTRWAEALTAWSALLVSLPMLWLLRKRLLAPFGRPFGATFGLKSFPRPLWWIGFTLALFALDQLGSRAIVDLFRLGGIGMHWSEGFVSFALWGHKPLVLANSIDACAWSPFFEELGFRGLLYATLRRHYRPGQAALFSGAVFGMAHFHSLPGLMSLTWSGFVYALAYERCRSILPGIVCSAWATAFAIAATIYFYR